MKSFAHTTLGYQYGSKAALSMLARMLGRATDVAMDTVGVAAEVFDMVVGHSQFFDTMTGECPPCLLFDHETIMILVWFWFFVSSLLAICRTWRPHVPTDSVVATLRRQDPPTTPSRTALLNWF